MIVLAFILGNITGVAVVVIWAMCVAASSPTPNPGDDHEPA